MSQGLLHMLNKHEANPPSATLVRGQSSYLQEQQIHLQSNPFGEKQKVRTLPPTSDQNICISSVYKHQIRQHLHKLFKQFLLIISSF